jgi:hypothetical protein
MGSNNMTGFQLKFTGGIDAYVDQSEVESNVRKYKRNHGI